MKEFIDKLIGRLEEKAYNHFDLKLSDAIEIVNELAEEYKGGWIPCSERLPDSSCDILATLECNGKTWVDKLHYSNTWMFEHMIRGWNFIAWQPLPQPFKE